MTAVPRSSLPRLDAITGLRWWAAFVVFVYHVRNIVPLPSLVDEFARFGYLGVTFFFVLSGFVLTWSWRPEVDKRTFYWRRFARIYPLHVVTLLLAIPIFYSVTPDPAQPWVKPFDVGLLLLCLLLLQGWSRDPVVLFAGNPAAWTLTAEAFFYAAHPFFSALLRRLTMVGALVAGATIVGAMFGTRALIVGGPLAAVGALPWPLLRVSEFMLGMCLAWALRKGWMPRIPIAVPLVLLGAWFAALAILPDHATTTLLYGVVAPYTNDVATAVCALLIVAVATRELKGRGRWLAWRPIVALGEWSFAFYLIHATVIYAALNLFGAQRGGWVGVGWIAGLLVLSTVLAWALHVGVEAPLERRMRRWQSRRRRADRVPVTVSSAN